MTLCDIPYFSVFAASAVLGVFGIRIDEEPRHSVVIADGAYQLRRYDPQILATVSLDGGPNRAFKRLAGYILGGNEGTGRIAMTAPVSMPSGEMTFSMPRKWTLETLPKPKDPGIRLQSTPARDVAVVRFRGRVTADTVRARTDELKRWMESRGLAAAAEPVLAQYDPPFSLPPLRRSEIHIEVKR